MGNTVFVAQNKENKNASATTVNYTVTSAITTGALVANSIARTVYNNSTGILYVSKGLTTGVTSFTTAAIPMTSAVFNPLSLDGWTGNIYLQSTTGASISAIVETVYLTWAST